MYGFREHPFVVMENSDCLEIPELKGRPILFTNKTMKHIRYKHGDTNKGKMATKEVLDII